MLNALSSLPDVATPSNRKRRRSASRRPSPRRLGIEVLEDRTVPAFVVDTFADITDPADGRTSLREAIALAAAAPGDDIVEVPAATYRLAQGQLRIDDPATVTIRATGGTATIHGDGLSRIFFTAQQGHAVLEGLTITGGSASSGGGILVAANRMTLIDCMVVDNQAPGSLGGGLFANNGAKVEIINSRFEGNSAAFGGGIFVGQQSRVTVDGSELVGNSAQAGAAIFTDGIELTVSNSLLGDNTATNNRGGAIVVFSGSVAIADSRLENNSTTTQGGALFTHTGTTVSITRTAVSGNRASSGGGGVFALGTSLSITDSTFSGNTAGSEGGGILLSTNTLANIDGSAILGNSSRSGAGILTRGLELTISDSLFQGNTTTGDRGGAIVVFSGSTTIEDSRLEDNRAATHGGAMFTHTGTIVSIARTTVSGNRTTFDGGAIFALGTTLSIRDSTLENNRAEHASSDGGAIFASSGQATIERSRITNNFSAFAGGAMEVAGGARVTLIETTLSGNTAASFGGAIFNFRGNLDIVNSTISGNLAGVSSGAIANREAATTILASTITDNEAANAVGAVSNTPDLDGTVTLESTIVAGNRAATSPDVSGNLVSNGFNLVGDGSGSTGLGAEGDQVGTAANPIDPLLGPLADNGGPTPTHALLPGSPAVDAGGAAAVNLATDQRGLPRIVRQGVDIGSFEVQNVAPRVADFTANGSEDAPLTLTLGDFTAAFVDPDSDLSRVRILGLPDNGVLTLNGELVALGDEIAAADLDGLVFHPDPDFFGTVALHYTAADEYGFAVEPATATLAIAAVNDAPTLAAPGPQTAYEDVDLALPPITVGDIDSATLTVTVAAAHGTVTVGMTDGLIVSGNGTGTLVLTGGADALNAALASLTYRGGLNFSGIETLGVEVSDGSLTSGAAVEIAVKSAFDQAADLIAMVDALESSGTLNKGRAAGLRSVLDLNGTDGDIDKVESFLEQVGELEGTGVLTPEQADPLLHFGKILLLSVKYR